MKKLFATLLLTLTVYGYGPCFLIDEMESGMNRICIYDCLDGKRAITINIYNLCPLSLWEDE